MYVYTHTRNIKFVKFNLIRIMSVFLWRECAVSAKIVSLCVCCPASAFLCSTCSSSKLPATHSVSSHSLTNYHYHITLHSIFSYVILFYSLIFLFRFSPAPCCYPLVFLFPFCFRGDIMFLVTSHYSQQTEWPHHGHMH